jgi:hypothetical protein
MLRTGLAFVVAPFPVALFQSAVVLRWPKPGTGILEHPASMFVAVCLYFYVVALVLGLPVWLVVARRSVALRTYALLGLVIALVPVVVGLIAIAAQGQGSAYRTVYYLVVFGVGGAAAGSLFWLVALRGKPALDLEDTFR